jgi:mediator of replication checkpoint protein 1
MSLQPETASTEKIDEATQEAEQEEDELPMAPRQFKRLTNRASSPQTVDRTERSTSPGLFVSSPIRPSPTKSIQNESASETELPPLKSDRFKALVERKRKERLAREAAEESRKAERRAQQEKLASELEQLQSDNEDNVSDITDDEGGRRLSQMARPTRKASRKAIEEMNQETQRMARSMQLAHEAKTRKKITKASLFERFNFKPATGIQTEPKTTSSSRPGTPDSDVAMQDVQTPPSSPPTVGKADAANGPNENASVSHINTEAQEEVTTAPVEAPVAVPRPKRQVRVRIPFKPTKSTAADSDDELEITRSAKDSINAVFNSIPLKKARNTQPLQALQMLAHLRSPGRDSNSKHTGMSPGELQDYLQHKVRQQAKVERDRRLETLKAQGVVIHTMEERERQMQEVEDIVAKAREEAQKIMQQERAEAKKERLEKGEEDPLGWDDSEDEEYEASADEHDEEASAIELSGSEDEDEDADMDDEDGQDEQAMTTDAQQKIDETTNINPIEEEDTDLPTWHRRPRKQTTVISDDEAEVEATPRPKATVHMTPGTTKTASPAFPTPVLRSAKKSFIPGLPVQGPAGLGLTQIFAGTMDDSQMSPAQGPTQSLMPDFDHFPDSNFSATAEVTVESMVLDSQREETQDTAQPIQLDLSQSQMRGLDSLLREESNTQISEMIEMSQDGGFQEHTPLKDRFLEVPTSTVDTVLANTQMDETRESPLARRGRLRRKIQSSALAMGDLTPSANKTAFDALRDGTKELKKKELVEEFNRKKSKAKEMIEEQAEESEDEYAGLGGADGEDSDDDSLASVEEIIDDTTNAQADADKLAAFYM